MPSIDRIVPSIQRSRLHFSATFVPVIMLFIFFSMIGQTPRAFAESEARNIPNRFGISASVGNNFSPNSEITFLSLSGISLIDVQRILPNRLKAPQSIRLKAEFSPGIIMRPDTRAIISAQVLALIYFDSLSTSIFKPFLEFGAGGIYIDYRVEGQDSRFNFLLIGGPGIEFTSGPLKNYFTTLRYHHISNGGLSNSNKAIDSLTFSVGYYF